MDRQEVPCIVAGAGGYWHLHHRGTEDTAFETKDQIAFSAFLCALRVSVVKVSGRPVP